MANKKVEELLYIGVSEGNIIKVGDALKSGAQNSLEDRNGWTALDVAAFNLNRQFCAMILAKTPYQWTNFEIKTPYEKVMTKNMTGLKRNQLEVIKVFIEHKVPNPFLHLIRRQYFKRPKYENQFIAWIINQVHAVSTTDINGIFCCDIQHLIASGKSDRFREEIDLIIDIGKKHSLTWSMPLADVTTMNDEQLESAEVEAQNDTTDTDNNVANIIPDNNAADVVEQDQIETLPSTNEETILIAEETLPSNTESTTDDETVKNLDVPPVKENAVETAELSTNVVEINDESKNNKETHQEKQIPSIIVEASVVTHEPSDEGEDKITESIEAISKDTEKDISEQSKSSNLTEESIPEIGVSNPDLPVCKIEQDDITEKESVDVTALEVTIPVIEPETDTAPTVPAMAPVIIDEITEPKPESQVLPVEIYLQLDNNTKLDSKPAVVDYAEDKITVESPVILESSESNVSSVTLSIETNMLEESIDIVHTDESPISPSPPTIVSNNLEQIETSITQSTIITENQIDSAIFSMEPESLDSVELTDEPDSQHEICQDNKILLSDGPASTDGSDADTDTVISIENDIYKPEDNAENNETTIEVLDDATEGSHKDIEALHGSVVCPINSEKVEIISSSGSSLSDKDESDTIVETFETQPTHIESDVDKTAAKQDADNGAQESTPNLTTTNDEAVVKETVTDKDNSLGDYVQCIASTDSDDDDDLSSHNEEIDEHDVLPDADSDTDEAKFNDAIAEKCKTLFSNIDIESSGVITISKLCVYLATKGEMELGEITQSDFEAAMEYYIEMFNPAVNKDIIDKADFLQFWGHLHTLFYMIDEDGDNQLTIVECVKFLEKQAVRYNLCNTDDLFSRVSEFFKIADLNDDAKITFLEFFMKLPKLEAFFVEKQYFDITKN